MSGKVFTFEINRTASAPAATLFRLANDAAAQLLVAHLQLLKSRVELVSGAASRPRAMPPAAHLPFKLPMRSEKSVRLDCGLFSNFST